MTFSGSSGFDHSFSRVDDEEGLYVLVCACGWRSSPRYRAAAVGGEWDEHLAEVERSGR
jgi:hypothetical protein